MSPLRVLPRNHGPHWGFRFLQNVQRLPRPVIAPFLTLGTWIAPMLLPVERAHSREYLECVLGRRARTREVVRHFSAYLKFLLLRLRVAGGAGTNCKMDPASAGDLESLIRSGEPALFGTFHFGHSDLLGFALSNFGRRIGMIRLRMANSADTDMLEEQFGEAVSFIWVNEPENLLFAIKSAIERGESLAMQCDRLYSSRTEPFQFLGATRTFPFAIYHLAILFQRPVMFCFGLPEGHSGTRVLATPLFRPDPAADRAANLARARAHFQAVLARLEGLVRQHPFLWFNFTPMNPVVLNARPS